MNVSQLFKVFHIVHWKIQTKIPIVILPLGQCSLLQNLNCHPALCLDLASNLDSAAGQLCQPKLRGESDQDLQGGGGSQTRDFY